MLEREIKLKISHSFFLSLLGEKYRYEVVDTYKQEDVYFDNDRCDLFLRDEALRMRSVGNSVLLTYKGMRRQATPAKEREEIEGPIGSKICEEVLRRVGIESSCSSKEEVVKALKEAGFREVVVVRKVRKRVEIDDLNCTVFLDEVDGLGEFVEVEGPDPIKLVVELGLACRSIRVSYAELLTALKH